MEYGKIEKKAERWNWVPTLQKNRYVVVNKDTGEIVNDANGYGYKNEEKCWSWIRMMQRQVGIDIKSTSEPKSKGISVVRFYDRYIGIIQVVEKYVPDLYQMACDYSRQRGNTFHFLKRQIEERYPDLKGKYDE